MSLISVFDFLNLGFDLIATSYWALLSLCPIRRPYITMAVHLPCSSLPKVAWWYGEKENTPTTKFQPVYSLSLYFKVIHLVKIYSDRVAVRRKQGYQFPIYK